MKGFDDKEILDEVLADFKRLAEIPRPSLHEKAVSDHLREMFRALGCRVEQDGVNNIIADRAASPGFEDAPRVILQAHMDMVCVAAEGVAYDKINDPIRLVCTEEYLSAQGTSLGADDGAGIAMILYIFRHAKNVGPLRAIITTDEETSMTGAQTLEAKYLEDADYLINWDSENYDELIKGSAGNIGIEFHRAAHWLPAPNGKAWRVSIGGLLGGHSGERIGDGRANALRVLASALLALCDAGITFDVASMRGGTARNAIPAEAEVVLVTEASEACIRDMLAEVQQRALLIFGDVDGGLRVELSAAETPARVLSAEDSRAVIEGLFLLHTGVFQMSPRTPGLVETSANLGILETTGTDVWFSYFARSSIDEKLAELSQMCRFLAARLGLEAWVESPAPGWKERKESKLVDTMTEVFEEQNGCPMKVGVIHAGLECGWHILKNPRLDMVSVGVTTHDIHSPKERLVLRTVAPQVRLVEETLRRLANVAKRR